MALPNDLAVPGASPLIDAALANGVRTEHPSIRATGVRTHAERHDALRSMSTARSAEEFLVNSRLRRGDVEMALSALSYFTPAAEVMASLLGRAESHGGTSIPLPRSATLEASLGDALSRRRSVRVYSGGAMPFAHLASIARAACGITKRPFEGDAGSGQALRATPSAGALYPVDLYVAAHRVDGLPRGIYVYDPWRDQLCQTGDAAAADSSLDALALPGRVIREQDAAAVCLLVGRPWRTMRKYGNRGMRHVFLEAGSIAAHISLAAAALGVGAVHCSSFYDDEIHEALKIDGVFEALVHSVFLGMTR